LVFEGFREEGLFAGVYELLTAGVYDEAEKGAKKREAKPFDGLLCSFGEATQKGKDLLRGQGIPFPVTELGGKRCKKVFIVPDRFFRVHPAVVYKAFGGLGHFHDKPPLL
jgi:hypothetical protein